ncbi:hypothetical protein F4780DRAFT_783072 [Xylariomycetidae sp. FL0641]|nr:hypothetical protein F4780DRAFT_783072 [Xylariomycetidae sp. FL0641]
MLAYPGDEPNVAMWTNGGDIVMVPARQAYMIRHPELFRMLPFGYAWANTQPTPPWECGGPEVRALWARVRRQQETPEQRARRLEWEAGERELERIMNMRPATPEQYEARRRHAHHISPDRELYPKPRPSCFVALWALLVAFFVAWFVTPVLGPVQARWERFDYKQTREHYRERWFWIWLDVSYEIRCWAYKVWCPIRFVLKIVAWALLLGLVVLMIRERWKESNKSPYHPDHIYINVPRYEAWVRACPTNHQN